MSCSNATTVGSRIGAILAAALTIAGTCGLADAQVVRPPGGTGNPSHGNGPGSGFSGGGFGSGYSDGNAPRPFESGRENRFGQGLNGNRFSNGDGRRFAFDRGHQDRGYGYDRRGGRFNRGLGIAALGGFGLGYGLGSSRYDGGYDAPYGYGSDFDGIGPGSSFGTTFYGPATGAVPPTAYGVDPNEASVAGLSVANDYAGSPGQSCRTPRKTCELRSEAPVGVGCSCKTEGRARLRGVVVE